MNTSDWQDNDQLCAPKTVYMFTHIIYLYVIFPISFFGIVLNGVSFWVFAKFFNQQQSYVFLLKFLSLVDMLFLFTACIVLSIKHVINNVLQLQPKGLFALEDTQIQPVKLFYHVTPLYFFFICLRNWCVVCVAMDRLVHIAAPLWSKRILNPKFWRHILVLLVLISFFPSIPFYFVFMYMSWFNRCDQIQEQNIHVLNESMADNILNWAYLVLIVFLPNLMVLFINIGLCIAMYQARLKRRKLGPNLSINAHNDRPLREKKHALSTVFVLTLIYMFCQFPAILDRILVFKGMSHNHTVVGYSRKVSLIFVTLDSLANFFGYVMANRTFRNCLSKHVLCKN